MARKLNKTLVGVLTVFAMLLMGVVGFALIYTMPGADPAQFIEQGQTHEEKEEWELAAKNFLRAYKNDRSGPLGRNPEWMYRAARCMFELGRVTEVRAFIKEIRLHDPSMKPAQELITKAEHELARAFPGSVQWTALMHEARRLAELSPDDPFAQEALGTALVQLSGENPSYKSEGEAALRRALVLDPTNADAAAVLAQFYYDERRTDDAEQLIETTILNCEKQGAKESQARLHVFRGRQLLARGGPEAALVEFKKSNELAPNLVDPHLALAGYHISRGRDHYDEAEAELMNAKAVDPKSLDLYLVLSSLFQSQQQPDKQIAILKEGLEANPRGVGFRFVRANYGRVLLMKELFRAVLGNALTADEGSPERQSGFAQAEEWIRTASNEVGPDNLEVRIMRAHLSREQGDLVQATREVEEIDRLLGQGGHYEVKMMRADLYNRQAQLGAAEEHARQAIAMQPAIPGAYILLSQILMRQERFDEAVRILETNRPREVYEALRNDRLAALIRVECYRRLEQYDKIEQELPVLEAVRSKGEFEDARLMIVQNRLDEAAELLRKLVRDDPQNVPAAALLAQVLFQSKHEDEARDVIASALRHNPDNRRLKTLSLGMNPIEDPEMRKARMRELLMEEPDPFQRAMGLYNLYVRFEDLDNARLMLAEAEKLQPDSPVVVEQGFRFALHNRDWDAAEKYCRRDAELDTDGTAGRIMRGRLAMTRGDNEKAIEFFREGLTQYPANSIGWTHLAEAYLSSGRRGQARETLERAIKLNPLNPHANRMLAALYLDDGQKENARKHLETAARVMPNDPFVKTQLQLMQEEKDPLAGIAAREKMLQEDPENERNLLALARLYAKTDQGAKAEQALRRVKELRPGDAQFAFEIAQIFGQDLRRPLDGEAVLTELLRNTQDETGKAQIALLTARFYHDLEDLQRAERYYLLAASLAPTVAVTVNVGEFYAKLNRPRDALDWYEKARDMAKGTPALLYGIRQRIMQSLILLRDKPRAEQEINAYLADYPDDEQGLLLRGLFYEQIGDLHKAEAAFRHMLEKQPDAAMAHWQLGQIYMLMGRSEQAIDSLTKAKAFRPDAYNYEHRITLARAYAATGRGDDALAELRGILRDSPNATPVARELLRILLRIAQATPRGDASSARFGATTSPYLAEAEHLAVNFMRQHPDDPLWPTMLGEIAAASGDNEKALSAFRQAAETSRFGTGQVMTLLATYEAMGRFDDLIEFMTKTLPETRRRRLPVAVAYMGKAWASKGDVARAIQQFNEALQLARDDFDAYRQIAFKMSDALGQERALTLARSQVEQEPDNLERLKIFMHLLHNSGLSEEALATGDRILQQSDRDDDLLFGMLGQAIVLGRMERFEDSRKKYEDVLEIDPNNFVALNNIAYILCDRLNRPSDALPYAERAEQQAPNDANTLDTLGWVLAGVGRLADAEGVLLRALGQEPNNIAVLYHLGVVYQRSGKKAEARERLEQSVRLAGEVGEREYGSRAQEALNELGGS